MKCFKFIIIVFIFLISCNSKPNKKDLIKLNGYWEIEKVEFPDGNKKEYKVNEFIDFISIGSNKGIRQKVAPQIDGTYIKGNLEDKIEVIDSLNDFYLKTNSKFTKWTERIVKVSDDTFVLQNETKITYYYKRFIPYKKR